MAFRIQCQCGKLWSSETPPTENGMQCPTCVSAEHQKAQHRQEAIVADAAAQERADQGERAIATLQRMREEYDDSGDDVFGRYEDAITLGSLLTLLESYEEANKKSDGGQAD